MDTFEFLTLSSWIPPVSFAFTTNTNETACGKNSSKMLSRLSFSPIPGVSTIMTFP